MKFRIKDEQLEKLVYSIFDEEDVQRQIAKQIDEEDFDPIIICSSTDFNEPDDLATKVKSEYEDLENKRCEVSIFINVDEIEKIREFDPNGWNPYPEITPPEQKRYLVFTEYEGPHRMNILYWVDLIGWKDEHVIAFRELPEPYEPEEEQCPFS